MLKDILEEKKAFKLVCGAGNEDVAEVEKLIMIYSLAGCNFFDICANIDVLEAAKRGLKRAGIKKDRYICISVGIPGDPHITKANINNSVCINCKKCKEQCPHEAIIINTSNKVEINTQRCIGCGICKKNCPKNAIEMISKIQDYKEILPELISKNIDCIEFHAISEDEKEVEEKWQELNEIFKGMLCISLDRSELGDKKLIQRVQKLLEKRKPYTTIIQADGVAMSGNDDEISTTLQAVATTQMFQKANLPAYIMISGGTNTKTMELAKKCGINANCLAVGSYARKIVKEYLKTNEIFTNKEKLNQAVETAKKLVDTMLIG